jgi:hypothetical protein
MKSLPPRLMIVLAAVQAIAFATFVRSVVAERWATVAAAVALFAGAHAALSSRTWGVGLALASGAAFGAAAELDLGPPWFWVVALSGVTPAVVTWRPMARFDRGAAVFFVALATGAGIVGALAFRALVH